MLTICLVSWLVGWLKDSMIIVNDYMQFVGVGAYQQEQLVSYLNHYGM